MDLTDLHNPEGWTAIRTMKEGLVTLGENQAFQCLPKRTELWCLDNGLLRKIKGWTTSVIMFYK